MTHAHVEMARRGWEAAVRGDFDTIAAMLDEDVKWHAGDPAAEGTCQNKAQALFWMRRARANGNLPELVDVRAVGDKVVLVLRPSGPDGPEDRLTANVTTLRDGKVVEMVHFDTAEDALRASGAGPERPS